MNRQKISAEALKTLTKKSTDIKIFDRLESTNTTAKQMAEQGSPEGSIIIAHSQTGGKGRLGRNFYSPENTGIYFSLILRPRFSAEDIAFITPLAAVAVAKAIEKNTNKSPKIKWVNDIFINGKKVCGILSEAVFSAEAETAKYIILGIGINLLPPKNGFPKDIEDIAGSLLEQSEDIDINSFLSCIINEFLGLYEDLRAPKAVDFYRKHLMLKNKEVTYLKNCKPHKGTVLDIDDRFRLIIKNESDEIEHLQSGEVTVGSKRVTKNG